MKRRVVLVLVLSLFLACVFASAQQARRGGSSESASGKSITIGVNRGSGSGNVAGSDVIYSVQITDDAGNAISGPVTMIVNVPETRTVADERWGETGELTPESAVPAPRWGVLVPLPDDFTQAPARSASQLGTDRTVVSRPVLANIVYSYGSPEAYGYGEDAGGQPAAPVTPVEFYSIPCSEFRPVDSRQTYKCGAWELRATNVIGSNAFIAPVHLPDGAEVEEFSVWVYDSDSRNDFTVSLDAVRLDEMGCSYPMAQMTSGGRDGIQELASYGVQFYNVDNWTYKYTITVSGFSGTAHHRLLGARIQYRDVGSYSAGAMHAERGW